MKRVLVPAFVRMVLALFLTAGVAAAEDIVLRTATNLEEAWIGQRVLLQVDVLTADGWAQISDIGELEISGTYVLRTESQGTRLSETIGRTAYTGQRYTLSLYCQRPGRVEIPAVPVTVTVKQWGANASETPNELETPSTAFTCKVPPGAEGIRGLISTTRLEADQSWSSEPDTMSPGDAISRKVTLHADDVSAMAFPPMQHPELEGIGVYPSEPSVADRTNRGTLSSERVETVTYVFEQPGEVELPGIVLPWWDIDDETLRRIELPGLSLEVVGELAPEPVTEAAAAAADRPRDRLLAVTAVVALIGLGLWLGSGLVKRCRRWWRARQESEPAHFKRVNAALRGGDPVAISGAILHWLDRLDPGVRPARLDLFLQDHGDDEDPSSSSRVGPRSRPRPDLQGCATIGPRPEEGPPTFAARPASRAAGGRCFAGAERPAGSTGHRVSSTSSTEGLKVARCGSCTSATFTCRRDCSLFLSRTGWESACLVAPTYFWVALENSLMAMRSSSRSTVSDASSTLTSSSVPATTLL